MKKEAIRIAAPCTVDWRAMTPADGGRFCGDCRKVVRDISRMSEGEARALLRSSTNQDLCVRYLHDRDGRIVFASEPRELLPASLLHRAKRVATTAAALAAPLAVAACTVTPLGDHPQQTRPQTSYDSPHHPIDPGNPPDDTQANMGGATYDPGMDDAAADAQASSDDASADAGSTDDASNDDAGDDADPNAPTLDGGDAGPDTGSRL